MYGDDAKMCIRDRAYAATVELSIYVDVAYRGRGIADRLMQELLSLSLIHI